MRLTESMQWCIKYVAKWQLINCPWLSSICKFETESVFSYFVNSKECTHFFTELCWNFYHCCREGNATRPWQLDSLKTCPLRPLKTQLDLDKPSWLVTYRKSLDWFWLSMKCWLLYWMTQCPIFSEQLYPNNYWLIVSYVCASSPTLWFSRWYFIHSCSWPDHSISRRFCNFLKLGLEGCYFFPKYCKGVAF